MGFVDEHKTLALATVAATGGALAFWITISSQRRRQQKSSPAITDFDSFLTKPIANPASQRQQNDATKKRKYAATSFEAYLTNTDLSSKNSQLSGLTTTAAVDSDSVSIPYCPPNAKPVTILYGTEFGFSREIAEKLCQRIENFKTSQYWPELINLADFPEGISDLEKCQLILIVCSTQGDGVPPTEVRDFCSWLGSANAATAAIGPMNYFSVLALGDRSYTHFARCGKIIDARLQELGATRFTPRVDVNKEDFVAVDGWIDAVLSNLDSLKLSTAEELGWNGVRSFISKSNPTNIANGIVKTPPPPTTTNNKWTKSKPYFASIIKIESLCNLEEHHLSATNGTSTDITTTNTTTINTKKNTFHVVIDLGDSGIEYLPGDALGIWPTNDPRDVDDVLNAAGISKEMEGNVVVKVPAWHYKDEEMELNISGGGGGGGGGVITLREALSRCYDLRCPKPEILQLLASKLDAINKKENGNAPLVTSSLNKSLNATSLMENGETYLAERHVADILRDWKPATITVDELLSVLRQLQPRLYSISSSPLEVSLGNEEIGKVPKGGVCKQGTPHTVAELTVAVVKYTSLVSGKSRVGVASTYLAERSCSLSSSPSSTLLPDSTDGVSTSSKVPVYVYKNPDFRLPSDLKTPIIMVGPGTGVAPFRAFIQHRILLAKAVEGKEEGNGENNAGRILGPALLFFGCRRRAEDYLYGTELEKWAAKGYIQLFTAFSRETEKRIYVQHRLLENGKLVWQLLEAGAVVYVCGDGAHMAGDVESALKSIIEGQGQKSAAAAVDLKRSLKQAENLPQAEDVHSGYFENMVKTGRYKKDVWVS